MSTKYYRGLINSLNDVKYKLQLASMTLKINENKNNISGIKNDISKINNFSDKINDNETNISSNLLKINDNDNDIDEIRSNLNNIKNELTDFKINYSIQNLFLFDINVERTYTLNKDNPEFNIFSYNLEDDFKSNVILEINCKILYNYNSYNNIGYLTHIYKLYDENNTLIYEYKFLKTNSGDNLSAYLNQNDLFYVKLNNNYTIIKIKLFLTIIDKNKTVTCKLLNTFKSNFLVAKLYKKINTLSVNNNLTDIQNDISSNLSKMNNNSSDILSNLSKINNNSSNISSNLEKINNILSSSNGNILKKVFVYDIEFYRKLIFSYTEKSYLIFSREIEFNFKAYNYIEIYSEILFDYLNHYEIGLLKTEYIFYDDRNIQIEKFEKYQNNSGSSSNNYLITKDYMLFINKSNNTKLKLDIYVSLIKDIEDRHTDFTVNFINNYKNKIYIKYYEK